MNSTVYHLGLWLALTLAPAQAAAQLKQGSVTVVLQDGLDGYAGMTDDGQGGALKLMDDRKATDPRWPNPNYRHLIRISDLDKVIVGSGIKITSATLSLFYYDEFWSVNIYHIAVQRSADGTLDNLAGSPEDTALVRGDKFKEGEKTPRPSWVSWKLRPETVERWLKDPGSNHGLVLRVAERDFSRGDQGNHGLWFRGCGFGTARERPRLTVTYAFTGNLPPRAPLFDFRYRGATVGRGHVIRWHSPTPPDADGDAVAYDLEVHLPGGNWQPLAKGLTKNEHLWDTAAFPPGDGYRLRLRARDAEGATSAWVEAEGAFSPVRHEVPCQLAWATPLQKIRCDLPYEGEFTTSLPLELARNEYEGVQLILANVNRELRAVAVEATDLHSDRGVIPRTNVTVRQVGYVNTVNPDKYTVPYVGLWPDPLLELPRVDVPVGRVQPLWLTVYAPSNTPAGDYRGTLTLKAENALPLTVELRVTVWDFTLPTPGQFRAMAVEGARTESCYDRLLANRLSPGYALLGWSWDKPQPPVGFKDGQYDFSEADRLAERLIPRGLNIFTVGRFPKPGKFGFPNQYSAEYQARCKAFLAAYAAHLRDKGWLRMGHVYNIDEAPSGQWPVCRQNYLLAKSAAPDLAVLQCLNEPAGVAALAGFADTWDVYIAQFFQSGAPARQQAGNEVIWAVCCYPATHPNLFIDYPAMDARIIGWLSWKTGVTGFEYWSVNSWGDNLKRLGAQPFLARVIEPNWRANTFGTYNGDGYLLYPGPNGALWSSMRLENLRDGIEDYEMLALLRDRASRAKARGENVAGVEKLLAIDDALCRAVPAQGVAWPAYTQESQALLAARRAIAQALLRLKD